MNADAFRHVYGYHFAENRTLWAYVTQLSDKQFMQGIGYSRGSVKQQLLHLIEVDEVWFSDLRGVELPEPLDPAGFPDLTSIRAYWDSVEQGMREYLAELTDEMLFTKPLSGEDADLYVWQVLLHVVNHGTDHRAQLLRLLSDYGVKTVSQDYVFYAYDNAV